MLSLNFLRMLSSFDYNKGNRSEKETQIKFRNNWYKISSKYLSE